MKHHEIVQYNYLKPQIHQAVLDFVFTKLETEIALVGDLLAKWSVVSAE